MDTSIAQLIDHIKEPFRLGTKEKERLALTFRERKIKRRGFLLQAGDVCRHFTFVVSGCFKMYAVDEQGKEHNLEFAVENGWLCDLSSFYAREPSIAYIEALEPSVVLQITFRDLVDCFSHYSRINSTFRLITERKYIELQRRVFQNISATAEERYRAFLHQYPELAKRLPNTEIASYLGITAEFLSKVRKDLTGKNTGLKKD